MAKGSRARVVSTKLDPDDIAYLDRRAAATEVVDDGGPVRPWGTRMTRSSVLREVVAEARAADELERARGGRRAR